LVLTLSEGRVVRDGLVVFSDERGVIEAIDRWERRGKYKCDMVLGDSYSIIMPGLVNTHTHISMSILQGLGEGLTGFDWLKVIWCYEGFLKPEHIYYSALLSIATMIENGITTFSDHYFYEEEVARAVEKTGIRAMLAKVVIEYSDYAPKHSLENSVKFAEAYMGRANGRITTMIGVHSLYSCSLDTVKKAVEVSESTGIRIHMHFSESMHELEFIKRVYSISPAQLAYKIGLLHTKPLLAHAAYLSDEDLNLLAETKPSIAYAPFTIMSWGQGVARVKDLVDGGVTVSLATDGPVTDGDLDLFKQMKVALAAQSSRYGEPIAIKPLKLVEMATRDAAAALGLNGLIGQVKPGFKADLVLLKPSKSRVVGLFEDPYTAVVYGMSAGDVRSVFVDGKPLMIDRRLLGVDLDEVYARVIAYREELINSASDVCKSFKKQTTL